MANNYAPKVGDCVDVRKPFLMWSSITTINDEPFLQRFLYRTSINDLILIVGMVYNTNKTIYAYIGLSRHGLIYFDSRAIVQVV